MPLVVLVKDSDLRLEFRNRSAEERDKIESSLTDQLGEAICFTDELTQILLKNTWVLVKKTTPNSWKYVNRPGFGHFFRVNTERANPAATVTHTLSSLHCTMHCCLPLSECVWQSWSSLVPNSPPPPKRGEFSRGPRRLFNLIHLFTSKGC